MGKEVRIGVFVCCCGSNIAGVVNICELVEYSKGLPGVVLVDEGKWSCSADYLSKLVELVKGNEINRVVIASCSPRTHEPLFKQAVKKAGINPYLLEFVSIREQVSWVHMDFPHIATQKAKDLVSMGVSKAALLEEGFEIKLPVGTRCLVIGGGVSGINAALSIAKQGFKAFIIEREACLGGLLKESPFVITGKNKKLSKNLLDSMLEEVSKNTNITVFTGSEILSLDGYIGNYIAKIKNNDELIELSVDTVIVATGMRELEPKGLFHYGTDERIITQTTLEKQISNGFFGEAKDVVMIGCVNSKNTNRGCCNIGCHVMLKNAIFLKKSNIDNSVCIMYRDLSICGESSFMLSEAKQLGVKFLRFDESLYPEIISRKNTLVVKVFDILLGEVLDFKADKVVLTTAFVGSSGVEQIKGLLKVSSNCDDFFQESHIKLNPLEFASDGIGLCGCAKQPMFFEESFTEGIGAAMRVSIPMQNGYTKAEGIVADIDSRTCKQCGLCLKECPYNAILLDEHDGFPKVLKALCRGCGLCAADCCSNSISIVHYSDLQIFAQIKAALKENSSGKIIGFVCHWCALGGVDMAGVARLQYPANIRLIRIMCTARVSIEMLKCAFELGAAGVLVAGCEFPTCHYINGNYAAKKRVNRARKSLEKQGIDSKKRLWLTWCSAADGPKFASVVNDMTNKLGLDKILE